MVIALPFVELARDIGLDEGVMAPHEALLAVVQSSPNPENLHGFLVGQGISERVADFLARWSVGEFRVLRISTP